MEVRGSSHAGVGEISEDLWVSTEPDYGTDNGSGLWVSEPNSVRGSFRAGDAEESALLCSLSVSEDGLSEYSEGHSYYGDDSGSRKSGRNSGAASPITTVSDRSSNLQGNRSLPSSAYVSSRLASSVVASGSSAAVSEASSLATAPVRPAPAPPQEEPLRVLPENGGVSPKRRTGPKGGPASRRTAGGGGGGGREAAGGDGVRGTWLGKPGGPPPRGQVQFQSCLRPGLGMSVRTILEEDEEGFDSDEEEAEAPARTGHEKPAVGQSSIPSTPVLGGKNDEKPADEPLVETHSGKSHASRASEQAVQGDRAAILPLRSKGNSDKSSSLPSIRAHEAPGCLCPVAYTPDASSVASDSPPGSPQGDRLSMAVYFCGLPGTSRKRRSCGLCGQQVGRRGPHCSLCRLVVYCDKKCLEQHQVAHSRNCPGASARRLREAATALQAAENSASQQESDKMKEDVPLRRIPKDQKKAEELTRKMSGSASASGNGGGQKSSGPNDAQEKGSGSGSGSGAVASYSTTPTRKVDAADEETEQPLRKQHSGRASRSKTGTSNSEPKTPSHPSQTGLPARAAEHPTSAGSPIVTANA